MSTVTPEERDQMAHLLNILNGRPSASPPKKQTNAVTESVELLGPGAVSSADINAMAGILTKLQSIKPTQSVLHEGISDPELVEAYETKKTKTGVSIGKYQILIKEDAKRLAGKQYYSVYHTSSNDIIADDISLYETALTVVRLLNNGKYLNSVEIRKLFEYDDTYTSHRLDALLYKRRLSKVSDPVKTDIYESRYQASIDKAMIAKRQIKDLSNGR